jgi:hypothetical protein
VLKEDGTAVCSHCGGSFTWKAGEAKLTQVGEFDAIKADVEELKQRLPASTPAGETPADPSPPVEEDVEVEDEDEDEDL